MEGHVRKRGDKWYYSFEASVVDGKRKRIERVGGRTKKEAEASLRAALQEYENAGLHFEPTEISVSDYMDYWFDNYVKLNCKYNTQVNYEMTIRNHIKPALGIYKLKSLTPSILQQFVNGKYLSGFSKNHTTGMITVLSGALKHAVHPCKFIKDNPMQYVKYPRYEHSKAEIDHKVISKKDFDKIIERFPFGSHFYMPIMIGFYTGCRIGEAMALTWADIDLENATIDINKIIYKRKSSWYFGTTKTESSVRKIKIGSTLVEELKRHRKWQIEKRMEYGEYYSQQYESEEIAGIQKLRRIHTLPIKVESDTMKVLNMVSTKEDGTMVTPDTFKYATRVVHYELGILFNFHSLRHTHATMLIGNHANMKDVQLRLGHARLSTTMDTYTHASDEMADQSVAIFEEANKPKVSCD